MTPADNGRVPSTFGKPWGSEREFAHNEPVTVKLLIVKQGEAISLQKHAHRSEFWRVLSGTPIIQVGETAQPTEPNMEFFIPKETPHRISAQTDEATVLEVSFGVWDANDIVRLEDKYGRTNA